MKNFGDIMKQGARKIWFATVFALAVTVAAPASADDPSFLSVGVGWYDFDKEEDAVDLRVEYRSKTKLLGFAKPWLGFELTSDIAAYAVGGILTDIFFGRRVVVTPSFGVGAYTKGDGKDLGSTAQFRSQIEIGYRFDDRARLALALSHISNAGLDEHNPGVNILSVYYHIPLDRF